MTAVPEIRRPLQTPASAKIVSDELRSRRLKQSFCRPVWGWSANATLANLSQINPSKYKEIMLILDEVKVYLNKFYQSDEPAILELPSADVLASLPLKAMQKSSATMKELVSRRWIRRNWLNDIVVHFEDLESVCQDKTIGDSSVSHLLEADR